MGEKSRGLNNHERSLMPSFYEILFTRSTAKSIEKVGRTVILIPIKTQSYVVYIRRYDLCFSGDMALYTYFLSVL